MARVTPVIPWHSVADSPQQFLAVIGSRGLGSLAANGPAKMVDVVVDAPGGCGDRRGDAAGTPVAEAIQCAQNWRAIAERAAMAWPFALLRFSCEDVRRLRPQVGGQAHLRRWHCTRLVRKRRHLTRAVLEVPAVD